MVTREQKYRLIKSNLQITDQELCKLTGFSRSGLWKWRQGGINSIGFCEIMDNIYIDSIKTLKHRLGI